MIITHHLKFLETVETYEKAKLVLFSVPYDGTVSFIPGTRFAGNSIREASHNLEDYSPYLDRSLQEVALYDAGEIEIAYGNKSMSLDQVYKYTRQLLKDGKKPIMIGGEHLLTYPAIQAFGEKYPEITLVQLDAHADLREEYEGEHLSHATAIRRCLDVRQIKQLWQLGIRSGTREEFHWMRENKTILTFEKEDLEQLQKSLVGKKVYITIDIDVFDPAFVPGVGTPEPGGIDFHQFLSFLKCVQDSDLIGFDLMELNPLMDHGKISAQVAAKILREMVLIT